VIFARAQGVDMKIVASICLEAAGKEWFSTTYMVKDDGPVRTAADLRGGTVGVVGIKTATDLWARAGCLNAGIVPDKDAKIFPMGFPGMGDAVRTGKISAGTFVEPFYSAEIARGGLRKLFTAVEAVGYDHELLDILVRRQVPSRRNPDAVRASSPITVAVTKYYLANITQAKSDLHKSGLCAHRSTSTSRTPTEARSRCSRRRREPRELSRFMLEKLQWLEKPVNVPEMIDQATCRADRWYDAHSSLLIKR